MNCISLATPDIRPPANVGDVDGPGDERFPWDSLVSRVLHPIQVLVVEALHWAGGPLAPSDIARFSNGEYTVNLVGYHMRALEELGVVQLLDTEPVRGATRHNYVLAPESKWR
jgi:hypothetical protein